MDWSLADHLTTDTYLTPAAFREQYGAVFPDGSVVDVGLLAMVWQRGRGEQHGA